MSLEGERGIEGREGGRKEEKEGRKEVRKGREGDMDECMLRGRKWVSRGLDNYKIKY